MNKDQVSSLIKNIIMNDFINHDRTGLYALTQKMMAYNSNKIEGSTLTSEQTASLFDTGTLVSNGIEVYRAKDIEEMNGHFKMFNYMLQTLDMPLSENLIKQYHYQLKNGVFEDAANGYPIGEYKNRPNIVSDIITANPVEVPKKIKELLNEYEASDRSIYDIAVFHVKYESIHPFQDGNGRTGRMIILKQCFENNHIPIIIKDANKPLYYRALHIAQKEKDYNALTELFVHSQNEYLDKVSVFIDCDKESSKKDYARQEAINNSVTNKNDNSLQR